MQSFNYILGYLRMNIFIVWIFFLPLSKLSFLFQVTGERNIGRHNIFPIQRARVQTTFSRTNPILEVAQTSVIKMSARLQPFQHQCLLFGSWINSVRVVHGKHPLILAQGMTSDKTWPKINRVAFHPDSYPADKERGFPPTKLNNPSSDLVNYHFS